MNGGNRQEKLVFLSQYQETILFFKNIIKPVTNLTLQPQTLLKLIALLIIVPLIALLAICIINVQAVITTHSLIGSHF